MASVGYLLIKWLHILAAIVALGANLTYFVWIQRMPAEKEKVIYTLKTISFIDRRIATPGYIFGLLTGLTMIFIGPWGFGTTWIDLSIVLFVAVAIMGGALMAPAMKKQLEAAEDPTSETYLKALKKTRMLGSIVTVMVLIILAMMVFKPQWW